MTLGSHLRPRRGEHKLVNKVSKAICLALHHMQLNVGRRIQGVASPREDSPWIHGKRMDTHKSFPLPLCSHDTI
jgi:hypothetical protein